MSLCFALLAFFLVPVDISADSSKELDDLAKKIRPIAESSPGNSIVGIAVVDIMTEEVIFARNADKLLNPASNTKIVTAAAALKILGPEYRFETELYGEVRGRTVPGPLYIKGYADPSLMSSDLWEMVMRLKAAGVKRIGGGIVVDDTLFDDENLPYAYDEQPGEDNVFRTPVGALSLNQNALAIEIRPGAAAMSKATVTCDPAEYPVVVNDSLTTASGAYSPKISATQYEERTKVRIWGQIPLGSRAVRYYRRIDNPSLFSGYGLKGVLNQAGISVGGRVRTGKVPKGVSLIARNESAPLSSVLWHLGKMSNNFVAEMVLKTMGSTDSDEPASWQSATGAVEKQLEKWKLKKGTYQYKNGSGLFDANRFSAMQFCRVISAAYLDTSIRPEFLSQLATGGVDGTIKSRYETPEARRYVRAKTGTLESVSALSGIVLDKKGKNPVAFSILVNRASGYIAASRKYQEKIATAIARFLNR